MVSIRGLGKVECDGEVDDKNDNASEIVANNVQFTMQLPDELSPELVRTAELGDGLCTTENWPTLDCNSDSDRLVD